MQRVNKTRDNNLARDLTLLFYRGTSKKTGGHRGGRLLRGRVGGRETYSKAVEKKTVVVQRQGQGLLRCDRERQRPTLQVRQRT